LHGCGCPRTFGRKGDSMGSRDSAATGAAPTPRATRPVPPPRSLEEAYGPVRERIRAGEAGSPEVEAWMKAFSRRLLAYLLSRGWPLHAAQDVVQDFWVNCFKYGAFESVEPGRGLAFFWTILENAARERHRGYDRAGKMLFVSDDALLNVPAPSGHVDPTTILILESAFDDLGMQPGQKGWMLWNKYVEGLSYADIRRLMERSAPSDSASPALENNIKLEHDKKLENNIKQKCHQARAKLRARLASAI
jgi:DNA-directed RNA polymerase specialized sigma24 family protein